MNNTKDAHKLKKEDREPSRGSGRKGLWTICRWSTLQLRISNQQPRESISFKFWDLDIHIQGNQKLPSEWCDECQVAYRDKHMCINKFKLKACIENRVLSIYPQTWM